MKENKDSCNDSFKEDSLWLDRLLNRIQQQKELDTHVPRQWQCLQNRIHSEDRRRRLLGWTRNIAAALFIPVLFLSCFFIYQWNKVSNAPVAQIEISANRGTKTRIFLPDGSEVWLNSGSTLVYPERFTENNREVALSGEAFFKVQADAAHRFDVKVHDDICVSAYGTAFNVSAFDGDDEVKATLAEGTILMEQLTSHLKTKLVPGEQAVYERDARKMYKEEVNLLVETSWKDGKIVFRRTKMNEVIKRLSRKFCVDIEVKDQEILKYVYSGTFKNESLTCILDLLKRTSPIDYEIVRPTQQPDLEFTPERIVISLKE